MKCKSAMLPKFVRYVSLVHCGMANGDLMLRAMALDLRCWATEAYRIDTWRIQHG